MSDCTPRASQDPDETAQPNYGLPQNPERVVLRYSGRRRRVNPEDLAREFWERAFFVAFEFEWAETEDAAEYADRALSEWRQRFPSTIPSSELAPAPDGGGADAAATSKTPGEQ